MKFSIIIPVYNVAPYLRKCLNSVVAAVERLGKEGVEIICVDDGSTDGSGEILDEYAERLDKANGNLRRAKGNANAKELAQSKIEEWVSGVSREEFCTTLEKLVEEKVAEGVYKFKRPDECGEAINGAKQFFDEFSRKIIELSDGRCVYFVPDSRSKRRNGDNLVRCWAEYAFHAVSSGGAMIPGKGYHERWYNSHKVEKFDCIEETFKAERCYVRLDADSRYDAIVFDGSVPFGFSLQVVARLDGYGNIEANLTEVTFTTSSKLKKKPPRLVALTEAVQTVVHHQITPGSYPQDKGIIANPDFSRNAVFRVIHQQNQGVSAARNAALDVATGEWVQFLDSDDSLELDFLEKLAGAIGANPGVDAIEHTAIYCYDDGRKVYGCGGRLPPAGVLTAQQILADPFGRKYTTLGRCSCYKIFRRSVIEKNQLRFTPGIPVAEDSLFAAQFYAYAGKIAVCPELAGYLRIFREGSALRTICAEKLIPQIHGAEVLYHTYRVNPSRGLAVNLAAVIVLLSFLGKDYGTETQQKCREAVLASPFYRGKGLRFVLLHGTWKMRIFAAVMLFSPRSVKRMILTRM